MYNILIVDDEEIICMGIQSMIRRINHPHIGEILYATGGMEAEELIPKFKPAIVITDIRMPDITGLELIENTQPLNKNCKFIVLSGFDDFSYAKTALKLGVIDYLLKPADFEELEKTLNRIIFLLNEAKDEPLVLGQKNKGQIGQLDERTIIGMAKKYVKENFSREVDMAVIANLLSVNYFYFSKLFKSETGMNFSTYLISVRMEEAKKLLDNPLKKIYEVSSCIGYDNPKNFSRIFRSYYGLSPEQYRKRSSD